ncbi:Type I inositol 3,4-bisphosphate 4-phosphatase [Tetrabaena socialis]|uniref:Type I inositol 3,4-bisphosphate 4-phosphatase n=1 Tax=Tetrabaena socialis TaxID=47790 RepID=A0A2J7ZYF3_9CHLO|nr:Type I inositol 3,4-bisphosphate 4-phosphatase [Tetrabaena socialis]|eukprot:PNH05297.1 Type I inositol 3,4-bisphosphate 4-phosphatase [Tetrabaena socialis]
MKDAPAVQLGQPDDVQPESPPGPLTAPPTPDAVPDHPTIATSARIAADEPPYPRYDAADSSTLLRKFSVHPTSSRRMQGLADVALMVLALLPTAVLRLIRAAMGLVGVTEHRWRGISMAVPLELEDRKQLELTAANLVAGRLGRRPEPPARGPVPPSQQLLLDTHAVLAAAASTAIAFGLLYDGHPEADLQAKLSSYLRAVAAGDTVCTQDCFKAMRKLGRKALVALCAAAPRMPAPAPPAPSSARSSPPGLRSSPSSTSFMARPKPKHVAKAYMTACLMQQGRSHAEKLIQLTAQLPDGSDLVETVSLVNLAPGAEYLRLLGGEHADRFAEQLEHMAEFGRLRPSDAKKEPEVQGMAINARVHQVGIVRHSGQQPRQQGAALAEGFLPPIHEGGSEGTRTGRWRNKASGSNDVHPWSLASSSRTGDANGSDAGYGGGLDETADTEGLLKAQRESKHASSSQPDLTALYAADSPDATTTRTLTPNVTVAVASAPQPASERLTGAPSFSAGSGPSTSVVQYPASSLDDFEPLYGCPRSGAFAVHGREPRGVGLSRLIVAYASCHALPRPAQAELLGSLGYTTVEELREEVELRKALCVAQALPVVVASLRLMCRSAACIEAAFRSGSFMHVQQSLLSDMHRHERAYLEDTKGALDVLAERLTVRFVEGSEKVLPLRISGSNITVSLPLDCVEQAALSGAAITREAFCSQTYGLTALVFNQGINSLQSLGFVMWGDGEPLQDTLNRHSLERLNEYALRACRASGAALAELNHHYSPEGRRNPKDTAMFGLVRRACSEVGAGRAVNCKSGKDRTALELCKAFADEVVTAGLLPRAAVPWLEAQFMRGLSYVTTSQNHGQPPAYAFNEMEILTLPAGWRPDWRLCGKVAS